MTVLTVIQDATKKLGISVPTEVFASTERTAIELAECVNEAAEEIFSAYDWELLRTRKTHAGDGATTTFTLPTDYDRWLKDHNVWSTEIQRPLRHVVSTDEWERLTVWSLTFVTGVWHKVGGDLLVKPAPASGATVSYWYISNLIVSPASGSDKATFTLDDDTFRLSERLLRLALIYIWRAKQGLPFDRELDDYQTYLEDRITKDRGVRLIRAGEGRIPKGINLAYPGVITP